MAAEAVHQRGADQAPNHQWPCSGGKITSAQELGRQKPRHNQELCKKTEEGVDGEEACQCES